MRDDAITDAVVNEAVRELASEGTREGVARFIAGILCKRHVVGFLLITDEEALAEHDRVFRSVYARVWAAMEPN